MKSPSSLLTTIVCTTATTLFSPAKAQQPLRPRYDRTPEELKIEVGQHLDAAKHLLDQIVAVTERRTVANTLQPANVMYVHLDTAGQMSGLLAQVHPDKSLRDAADAAEQAVATFVTELGLNRELYAALKSVEPASDDPEAQRVLFKVLRDFRRSGVDRDEVTRRRVKELQEDLVKLGQEFANHIRDDVRRITLDSPRQLEGLPEDYLAAHGPDGDGKITISTDYPDYVPFMTYARDAEARRRLYVVYRQRAYPANVEVLGKLLARRFELAVLLGYKNYAEYITEDKMIRNAAAVEDFVNRIAEMAEAPAAADMALLLAEKRRDHPDAASVSDDEKFYYEERVKSAHYKFASQEARPYFEFHRVRQGLFDVTGRLFGVEYRPVSDAKPWHPSVSAWDVYQRDRHIGRFLLDLHPREGKYKHAACFSWQTGIAGRQIPVNALVCNFVDPADSTGPALMEHSEVVTFFHEFGHLLHALFSGHHEWINVSGISTEWDFVEAPSQMLEEWTWDAATLRMFAKHHLSGEPIPTEMVQRMRAARDFGKGLQVRQQMFYAALSLNFHHRDPKDLDLLKLLRELTVRYAPCPYVEETYLHCSFGHLTGYSAIYYTYMWSLVIAKDLFSEFEKSGLFEPAVAERYRRCILEPGGARDAAQLIKEFLGRDYSFDAYGRWLKGDHKP